MQRELKHIAPYIQHGLTCNLMGEFDAKKDTPLIFKVTGIDQRFIEIDNGVDHYEIESEDFFPLLRPMSELFKGSRTAIKEIIELNDSYDYNNSFTEVYDSNEDYYLDFNNAKTLPYQVVEILFKYHFDVFGLIEKGLAQPIKNK